jgi:alpha-maltose-1-phosphate synthase
MNRRVAVLRGRDANPFELQNYQPLVPKWDLSLIAAVNGAYSIDSLGLPTACLRDLADQRVARRLLGDRSGRLLRLEKAIAGSAIVHSAETFLPISEQAAELRSKHGFKLVLTCWENIPFLYEDAPALARRKQAVRESTDLFIAVTERAREALLLERVPAERIVVQPMGVDHDVFRPCPGHSGLRPEWNIPDGFRVVLYSGRLIREKGILDLLRAIAKVPHAILVIAGSGPEQPRLDFAARSLAVESRVRFTGGIPYGQMADAYAAADVFCLPSLATPYWEEQFGMVLVEAMASGVPIITTTTGSIPEVVGDAAVLVPAYTPDALSQAIACVLKDSPRRSALIDHGLQRASDRYDARKVAEAIGRAYAAALS